MKAVIALTCSKVALDGPPFPIPSFILAKQVYVKPFPYAGVSRAERVARERHFPELCRGAGSISFAGTQSGSGRGGGWLCLDQDAFDRDRVRRFGFAGAVAPD